MLKKIISYAVILLCSLKELAEAVNVASSGTALDELVLEKVGFKNA